MICVVYKLYNILSVLNFLKMNRTPQCKKCERKFSTASNLEKHLKKKIPCNRVLKCEKCEKVFKYESEFKKHQDRKTPCEPIQGDPTKETPENTCHFCYKKFSGKQALNRHYNICKIKNGGMVLLFNEVKRLKEQIEVLQSAQKTTVQGNQNVQNIETQNIETQNIANHNNTVFNFTLINFGKGQKEIVEILTQEIEKLGVDANPDVPYIKQVKDRIIGLVMQIHRNPEQKELQNIYVTDPGQPKDNAFFYEDGKWQIEDWDKLNKKILRNLYDNIYDSNLHRKEDKLDIIKHIFVSGGCGDIKTIQKMTDTDLAEMYLEIGTKLNFKTITL